MHAFYFNFPNASQKQVKTCKYLKAVLKGIIISVKHVIFMECNKKKHKTILKIEVILSTFKMSLKDIDNFFIFFERNHIRKNILFFKNYTFSYDYNKNKSIFINLSICIAESKFKEISGKKQFLNY